MSVVGWIPFWVKVFSGRIPIDRGPSGAADRSKVWLTEWRKRKNIRVPEAWKGERDRE